MNANRIPLIHLCLLWISGSMLTAQDWTYVGPGGGDEFYIIDSSTYLVTADYDSKLLRHENGVQTTVYDTESWINNIKKITDDGQGNLYTIVDIFDSKSILFLKSVDQGKTWETTLVNNICDDQFTVYFVDPLVGFIGGDDARIIRTEDGGKTWKQVFQSSYSNMFDFTFINSMEGFAVGGRGTQGIAVKTTDGGKTWQHWVNCGRVCHMVMFSSPCVGYISSFSAVTRVDLCSGTTRKLEAPDGNTYGPVHFVNDRIGYLSVSDNFFGSEGYFDESEIYITFDAGETWQLQTTPDTIAIPTHFKQHEQSLFLNAGNITNETPDVVLSTEIPPYNLVFVSDFVKPVSCNGSADGEIHLSVSGGTPPYEIFWSVESLSGEHLTGLSGGEYDVIIRDSTGLYAGRSMTLHEPVPIHPSLLIKHETNHKENGVIKIHATGGIAPYTYHWSHNDSLGASEATGLLAGQYEITVTDANGCLAFAEVSLMNLQGYLSNVEFVDFEVIPNPVQDGEITLHALQALPPGASFHLFNLAGQTLISGVMEATNTTRIDLTGIEPGLYFLRIENDATQLWVSRIVIQ